LIIVGLFCLGVHPHAVIRSIGEDGKRVKEKGFASLQILSPYQSNCFISWSFAFFL